MKNIKIIKLLIFVLIIGYQPNINSMEPNTTKIFFISWKYPYKKVQTKYTITRTQIEKTSKALKELLATKPEWN